MGPESFVTGAFFVKHDIHIISVDFRAFLTTTVKYLTNECICGQFNYAEDVKYGNK